MTAPMRTVVLVGHCGPDMHMLRTVVSRSVPGASIVAANDEASLARHLDAGSVLLVNRSLDGDFDAEDGVDLIRRVRSAAGAPEAMLISNYAESQAAASAAGAMPGFGKSQLYAAATAEAIRKAVLPESG